MAKKVIGQVKLQIAAGKATPAPPVGTALGPHGVNIMDFCKAFNAKTAGQEGLIIPAVVTVYQDRSYSFITKTPPAAVLLKRAANIAKGSGEPNRNKVGTVTRQQVEEIAKTKMPDLNAGSIEMAAQIVKGTARSMGIDVLGPVPADTVFNQNIDGKFDVCLAMYHDQGHIPIKVHDWQRSVSVNLGLPFVRTSVDHGTAFDIAGKGVADHISMMESIKVAVSVASENILP